MELDKFIRSINIPVYSITSKIEYFDINDDLNNYNRDNPLEFCRDKAEDRLSGRSILKDVKSIITLLIPYEIESMIRKDRELEIPAIVSNNAWEMDYHRQLKDKLAKVGEYIGSFFNDLEYESIVDTSPLIDRIIAYESGLGSYGKNTFLINEKLGTAFYIGALLINKEVSEINILKAEKLEYNTAKEVIKGRKVYRNCSMCMECDLCVRHCPGKALDGSYTINSNKCVSYLTQKKDRLSYEERKLIGKRLYGCDICQIVCPYNKTNGDIKYEYKRTSSNVVDALELIKTSNKQLVKKYKSSGFIWRGPNILKRNAIVIIGNSRSEYGLSSLMDYYFDLSLTNRLYALWAIASISFTSFKSFIDKSNYRFEKEEKEEVEKLLINFK